MRSIEVPFHLIVMGVSGCGKSTVAKKIQEITSFPLAEADDFHPKSNKTKMAAGIPLTDTDRLPWLESLRDWMTEQYNKGNSTVMSCSALKINYRRILAEATGKVLFIHLVGNETEIVRRMSKRKNHFMPTSLVPSQFAALENLTSTESGIELDMNKTPAELAKAAVAYATRIQNKLSTTADKG